MGWRGPRAIVAAPAAAPSSAAAGGESGKQQARAASRDRQWRGLVLDLAVQRRQAQAGGAQRADGGCREALVVHCGLGVHSCPLAPTPARHGCEGACLCAGSRHRARAAWEPGILAARLSARAKREQQGSSQIRGRKRSDEDDRGYAHEGSLADGITHTHDTHTAGLWRVCVIRDGLRSSHRRHSRTAV